MYLSRILVNLGDNPNHLRPGRLWLRNLYRVHQRLCMAFPSAEQVENDPQFIKQFKPDGFRYIYPESLRHVGEKRSQDTAFLFRIDPLSGGRTMVLVQSAIKPDWEYAFQNARMLLAAEPEVRDFDPVFEQSEEYRFRVRICLSKKGTDAKYRKEKVTPEGTVKNQGKRIALTWEKDENPNDVIRKWFTNKSVTCGFELTHCEISQLGWVIGYKTKDETIQDRPDDSDGEKGRKMTFRSVLIDGTLKVMNFEELRRKVISGIGSAKAFGFGLLSISR